MCIIICKPEGVQMPSNEILKNCWETNGDGAGFMYSDGKTVHIEKGFMDFDGFIGALNEFDLTDFSVVMHCRIATHGGVSRQTCHPFPVTSDEDELRALSTSSRIGIAHNGIIQGMATDRTTSDTMAFIRDIVAPIRRLTEDFPHNDNALDVLDTVAGSKLAILDNSGDIVTIGEFIEDNGVMYSNTSYLYRSYGIKRWNYVWDDYEDTYEWPGKHDEAGVHEYYASFGMFDVCHECEFCEDCFHNGVACSCEEEAEETVNYMKMT